MLAEEWDVFIRKMSEYGHAPDRIERPGLVSLIRCECGWESEPRFFCEEFIWAEWKYHAQLKTDEHGYG